MTESDDWDHPIPRKDYNPEVVACEYCDAKPEQRCTTPAGNKTGAHAARVMRWTKWIRKKAADLGVEP